MNDTFGNTWGESCSSTNEGGTMSNWESQFPAEQTATKDEDGEPLTRINSVPVQTDEHDLNDPKKMSKKKKKKDKEKTKEKGKPKDKDEKKKPDKKLNISSKLKKKRGPSPRGSPRNSNQNLLSTSPNTLPQRSFLKSTKTSKTGKNSAVAAKSSKWWEFWETEPENNAAAEFFEDGFIEDLNKEQFVDVVLIYGSKEYRCHQLILAYSSYFFVEKLEIDQSRWRDGCRVLELDFPDPHSVFPDVLNFLYTSKINLTSDNALPLLAMADYYLIPDLMKRTSDFISGNIHRANVLGMLEKALKFRSESVINKCINVIAKNFCYIYTEDYSFLPPSLFRKLLYHETLAVKNEYVLYRTICNYIESRSDELSKEDKLTNSSEVVLVKELMEAVRFRWFTQLELPHAISNPLVPRELLVEALMSKLEAAELTAQGRPIPTPTNKRLMKREVYGITFEWRKEYEGIGNTQGGGGILTWIATNCGRTEWEHPHLTGRVEVQASSIEKGSPHDLVSQAPTELWTKDIPASWFSIDLGNTRLVTPTHYTLRHGGNYRADSLRTWDFQGSVDGITWCVLRHHTTDSSLNGPFAVHSWPIHGAVQRFRYFRIIQTGHNSSNHNFLVLSGVEIYGELYEIE